MKLSAYTDVCLRVLMTLAAAEGERLTSQQIADRIQVPYNHVIKAVAELRRRGTIEVLRGRHGGAMIAAAGLDQRVGELVRSLSSRDEVIEALKGARVPAGYPYTAADIVKDPHYLARQMIEQVGRFKVRSVR